MAWTDGGMIQHESNLGSIAANGGVDIDQPDDGLFRIGLCFIRQQRDELRDQRNGPGGSL